MKLENPTKDQKLLAYSNIPDALKEMKQWVCFKLEENLKKGKPDKVPYNPRTGYRAKCNDPRTWADYKTAIAAWERGGYDGLGFQFANGVFGIDIDHVVVDGKLTEEASDILNTVNSYAEYSPSGTGIHIICHGTLPEGGRRKGNVEMYSTGRFFTMTGATLGTASEVHERTEAAALVHSKYIGDVKPKKPIPAAGIRVQISGTDAELIEKAMNSRSGGLIQDLWAGDITTHGSDHSTADLALINHLAYWTNGDSSRMDRMFRQSGLMRDKWDEQHGRGTYGEMTIAKALENFISYNPDENKKNIKGRSPVLQHQLPPKSATLEVTPTPQLEHTATTLTREISRPDAVDAYLENGFLQDIKRFGRYKNRKTGFQNLDRLCGSLYPGLYVIGAISSLGKTTFTLQLSDQLAAAGEHVLYFSLEQNRLELVTKSISRTMAQRNKATAISAIPIRGGLLTREVISAAEEYATNADKVNIIECNFETTINSIMDYTKTYMKMNPGITPIVFVDYMQIIPPTDPRQSDKEKVDHIVRGLKKLQSENDLVVVVVSSINRSNYLQPIDFESFKESGGIEYTADVVWGLQLQTMNDPLFCKENKIREKRAMIKTAKMADPRKVELVCLKNRYGAASYSCGFDYFCRFDLFEEDKQYMWDDGTSPTSEGRL